MERVNVIISKELYEEILRIVKNNRYKFNNVEDCIDKMLREMLNSYVQDSMVDNNVIDVTNNEEDKDIKDRLKRLGYI
jgi:metal-responsive CopG/Arc/MetJ family transcriptional regulator